MNRSDVVVNLVGFVPVGLVLVWALRRWTALGESSLFWLAIFVGFSLSLSIETTQAFLPGRVSTAGDLALNTAGSALGALLGRAVSQLGDRGLRAGR